MRFKTVFRHGSSIKIRDNQESYQFRMWTFRQGHQMSLRDTCKAAMSFRWIALRSLL